jgi:tetratricopeptide (TPR) repeat protein
MRPGLVAFVLTTAALLSAGCHSQNATYAQKLADSALGRGEYDTAIRYYDEAIRQNPQFARPYHGRGVAYLHKQQYDEAIASIGEAIRLDPKNDVALFDRGLAHWQSGDTKNAIADFSRAIEVNPRSDGALNGLAWALATAPQDDLRDGKKAAELAIQACELTEWKHPFPISSLAAAHAEMGDFQQAIELQKKAMLSRDFPQEKMDRGRERLKLYEQGKPYREVIKAK